MISKAKLCNNTSPFKHSSTKQGITKCEEKKNAMSIKKKSPKNKKVICAKPFPYHPYRHVCFICRKNSQAVLFYKTKVNRLLIL